MKTAEPKTTSTTTAKKASQPFFSKDTEGNFFGESINRQASFFKPTGGYHVNRNGVLQTKLTIGKPDDKYEKEADQMADKVVQRLATPESLTKKETGVQAKPLAAGITLLIQTKCEKCGQEEKLEMKEEDVVQESPLELQRKPIFESNAQPPDDENNIQRKCAACESAFAKASADKEEKLQRKSGPSAVPRVSSDIESNLNSSKGNGNPLPANIRTQMENSFGTDFSNVKLHTDSAAVQMNKDLHAQAFTHGSDIYFNAGKYDTNSTGGKHLLAHELTHVVQQGKGHTARHVQRQPRPETRSSGGSTQAPEAVVILGRWDQTLTIPGRGTIRLPTEGSQALLRGQAIAVFPGREPTEVMGLPGAFSGAGGGAFPAIAEEGRRDMARSGPRGWRGLPSGVAVQEALEGGTTIRGMRVTAIFINVAGVDVEHGGQTSSEYRQIVAALASGRNTQVDIVIRHGSNTSIVRRGSQTVEGDPLPAELRRHLPPTFRTLSTRGGTGGGGDDAPSTPPRRQRATRPRASASESEGSTPGSRPPTSARSASRHQPGPRTTSTGSSPAAPRRHRASRASGGSGRDSGGVILPAASAGRVAMDIAEIFLAEWIQETFYDPQNRAAFNQNLAREQPRIDRMVARHRAVAQRIRAHGGVPYAVVTLHVIYRTFGMPDGIQHSSFLDLWVTDANIESAPREDVRNPYLNLSPSLSDIFDPETMGRTFRNEDHRLIIYSYEIPETDRFEPFTIRELASRLYAMYQYIIRIMPREGEAPEEAINEVVAIVHEMRDLVDRTIDIDDEDTVAELREELIIYSGYAERYAQQAEEILNLVRMVHGNG